MSYFHPIVLTLLVLFAEDKTLICVLLTYSYSTQCNRSLSSDVVTAALFYRTQDNRITGPAQNGVLSENRQVVFHHILRCTIRIFMRAGVVDGELGVTVKDA